MSLNNDDKTIKPMESEYIDYEINLITLLLYASIWLFCNIALIGFVVVFWLQVIDAGFNGVNYGKFIVVSHSAVIIGLYKVNKKYFKFINILKNKLLEK